MTQVLIIDDSNYNRRLMKKMLAEKYEVVEANNGRQGLDVLSHAMPDCILLDLMMPDIGGVEMLEILYEQGVRLPIIVVTADIQQGTQERCLELGAHSVLHKPVTRSELLRSVHEAIEAF